MDDSIALPPPISPDAARRDHIWSRERKPHGEAELRLWSRLSHRPRDPFNNGKGHQGILKATEDPKPVVDHQKAYEVCLVEQEKRSAAYRMRQHIKRNRAKLQQLRAARARDQTRDILITVMDKFSHLSTGRDLKSKGKLDSSEAKTKIPVNK